MDVDSSQSSHSEKSYECSFSDVVQAENSEQVQSIFLKNSDPYLEKYNNSDFDINSGSLYDKSE